jgi:hypothetical protein
LIDEHGPPLSRRERKDIDRAIVETGNPTGPANRRSNPPQDDKDPSGLNLPDRLGKPVYAGVSGSSSLRCG